MDSSESDPVHSALKAQGVRIHQQEEQLNFVCQDMFEAEKHNVSVCATSSAQLSFVIVCRYQKNRLLQQ